MNQQFISTNKLFLEDAYLSVTEAEVIGHTGEGGVILDRTVFYATSGGQPGDSGFLELAKGSVIPISSAEYTDKQARDVIAHMPEPGAPLPPVGEKLVAHIHWERRHAIMRMHTAMHLMCALIPVPVTGGGMGPEDARIDFVLPEVDFTKEEISERLMALVDANHPVSARWVDDSTLDANPELVRTMSVQPPRGAGGRIRLVSIGTRDSVDLQPCGGTHVQETAEIGPIHVAKIENKGKQNRRLRLRFNPTES